MLQKYPSETINYYFNASLQIQQNISMNTIDIPVLLRMRLDALLHHLVVGVWTAPDLLSGS